MERRGEHETSFTPTPTMRRFARACVAAGVRATIAARCKRAHITHRTFTRWRRDPAFEPWLQEEIHRLLTARTWEVWRMVHRAARQGNLSAAKMFVERFDNAPEPESPSAPGFTALALEAESLDPAPSPQEILEEEMENA